ncbi:helix-turn-helix domain-containing protein [Thiorhodococcus minor]|uniref:Helix-turn-helix domain-containing protein n=1 Tax=Thiorhodococcus minor TaxID=57489 RepID=A0A6M0K4L2_9GAMM|nr:helix-turn-helix domain-containing protein [Thiorhodococcus minor]
MLTFLARHPERLAFVAAAAGTKPVYLRQVARGHRRAGHALARAIERATDGLVTIHDLRPDIFGPPPGTSDAAEWVSSRALAPPQDATSAARPLRRPARGGRHRGRRRPS